MPTDRRQWLGLLAGAPLSLAALPAGASAAASTRMYLLVRHAEKATDDPRDPTLNEAGQRRARALAELVGGLPIDRICVTPLRRTALTAAPTAEALGLHATPIEFGQQLADHVAASVQAARGAEAGASLLVGHSNTVPLLVAALGGPADLVIDDAHYHDLFLLIDRGDGQAPWFLRASYGSAAG